MLMAISPFQVFFLCIAFALNFRGSGGSSHGDKQVLTNAVYTSAEHRVTVDSDIERVSLALFYNPKGDLPIGPAKEFVSPNRPALYSTNTFDEYKLYLRTKGLHGKSQIEESPKITQV